MRIYVASSWRNEYQPLVVSDLREAGHEVYDFRNPPSGSGGFGWSQIDPDWKDWTTEQYVQNLTHPIALEGYAEDYGGMMWADVCVLLLPSGRSAHIEAGWFAGRGKPLLILSPDRQEPELMYLLAGMPGYQIHCTMAGIVEALDRIDPQPF